MSNKSGIIIIIELPRMPVCSRYVSALTPDAVSSLSRGELRGGHWTLGACHRDRRLRLPLNIRHL